MKIISEKTDLKKTFLAIFTMLLGVVCVDLYLVVIRLIGNDYSVFKLAVFRNFFCNHSTINITAIYSRVLISF